MDIIIKKMETEAEILGKGYVHWKSWQEAYPGMIDRAYLDALSLEKCEDIARRWPDNILVAKDGERVVGFAAYGKYRSEELADAGEIFAIYILSEYYGSGAGRALMEAALERIAEYPRIAVWVLRDNGRAIAFYRKCGFVPDGAEEEITLGTPVTEIRMMLDKGAKG